MAPTSPRCVQRDRANPEGLPMTEPETPSDYTPYATVETRGQGLIGLMSCRRCGATLTIEPEIDVTALHDEWHAHIEANLTEVPL